MIRTKLAKKVLTKKEQRHLTEQGINSMKDMVDQVAHMKEMDPEKPYRVCVECNSIARRLGL